MKVLLGKKSTTVASADFGTRQQFCGMSPTQAVSTRVQPPASLAVTTILSLELLAMIQEKRQDAAAFVVSSVLSVPLALKTCAFTSAMVVASTTFTWTVAVS